MLTIKWYLAANGSTQVLDKNFPVYQGQYQNILLNIFVPTSLLAPNFTVYANEYQNVVTPYVAGTGVKVGMVVTDRDGSYIKCKDYFCRYIKTLVKDNVEYALFERKLPQEFTLYAAYGVSAAQMIANVVNVQYGQITSASATSTNSTLAPTVDLTVLASKVPAVSQNYTFTYHIYTSTAQGVTGWYLNSEYVHLSDYGITLSNISSPVDNDTIVLFVTAAEPTVLRVATSQTYPLDVLPSSRLLDDEVVEATNWEDVQAQLQSIQQTLAEKQNIEDNSLQTKNKTVPTAINENRQDIMTNAGEIANNTADIAEVRQSVEEIKGQIENGTDYLGTLTVADNLPTDEELLAFAKQERGATYTLKNQDVIIVIVTHADATDENYKYTYNYFKGAWDYFKIPPMEKASNGTFGILQGTYGIGKTHNVLVDIVGGEIREIYVLEQPDKYTSLVTKFYTIAQSFSDITSGQTQVGFAKKAEQDGNGANIAATYLPKALGATKQYVRDYALPNEFNDVAYYTKDGFVDTLPTEQTEVQNVVNIPSVAQTPIFSQVAKTLTDVKFELASKNSFNSKFYVAANKNMTATFTLLTYARIGGETQLISSSLSEATQLQADVIKAITFVDNFGQLGKDVLRLDSGDAILQTLLVTPSASETDRTITLYSGETYPSTFYLHTSTTTLVQGSLGDIDNISFPYGEPTVTYDTTDGIRVSGIFRFTAGTTDTDIPFEMEIPIVAENHLVADATTQNTHVIIKLDPEWEKTVQNEYLQSYESATIPSVGQVLTLTNANFARKPIVGQSFRLLEVVNINDTYESTLQVLTVGETTCTAKIMSFTDITSGKVTKVTEATTNTQFYAKAPDGSQVMTEIKGGNGITVGAASDNKFLEVKVGDTIKISENQSLTIADSSGLEMITFKNGTIDFDPQFSDAFTFTIGGDNASTSMANNYGPNIKVHDIVIGDNGDVGAAFYGLNMYYEITGVPTSSTSGTLPNDQSWSILQVQPQDLRILFNKEFYQFADNQHTTGTLVFSHVGYEASQLIIKTITITIATRGWVLTTIKPAESAYHVELTAPSGTLTKEQVDKLVADTDSYVLYTDANSNTYKLCRNILTPNALTYSVVVHEQEYRVMITLSTYEWQYTKVELQNVADRVSEIGTGSTVMYPNTKAVYDADQSTLEAAKAYADTAIANAITTALNTPV